MKIESVDNIKNAILYSLEKVSWGKVIFKANFSGTGSCNPKLWVYNYAFEEIYFDFEEIFDVAKFFISLYKQYIEDLNNRFNKVEFDVFKDGSYKVNYYWDESIVDEQKAPSCA